TDENCRFERELVWQFLHCPYRRERRSSTVRSSISTVFRRLVTPRVIRIARLGICKRSASKATSASFAAPSIGGAVSLALSCPSLLSLLSSHSSVFLPLRGMTRIVMRIASLVIWLHHAEMPDMP